MGGFQVELFESRRGAPVGMGKVGQAEGDDCWLLVLIVVDGRGRR